MESSGYNNSTLGIVLSAKVDIILISATFAFEKRFFCTAPLPAGPFSLWRYAMTSVPKGFGGFVKGTHKEVLAQVFAKQGRDAAMKDAARLGVKRATIATWMSGWRRQNVTHE